jgi:uncharacterized protein YjbI with pentapeptide repeats
MGLLTTRMETNRTAFFTFLARIRDDFKDAVRSKLNHNDFSSPGVYFPSGIGNFGEVTFTEKADFTRATFEEGAGFEDAHFEKGANLHRATFKRKVDFSRAAFERRADFTGVCFEKGATFRGVRFEEWTNFYHAHFNARVTFYGTSFKEGANLSALSPDVGTNLDLRGVSVQKSEGFVFRGAVLRPSAFIDTDATNSTSLRCPGSIVYPTKWI